jgi:hypothetical protein
MSAAFFQGHLRKSWAEYFQRDAFQFSSFEKET